MSARELFVRGGFVRKSEDTFISRANGPIDLSISCLMQDTLIATSRRFAIQTTSFDRPAAEKVSGVFRGWMGYIEDARQRDSSNFPRN